MSAMPLHGALKGKSILLLITEVCCAALSLFGSAGSSQFLGGVAPELLRNFQVGEKGRPSGPCLRDLISHVDTRTCR